MRRPDVVTRETFRHDGISNYHPRSAGLVMTVAAISNDGTVRDVFHRGGAVVRMVSEAPVSRARSNTWLPADPFLHYPIVTGFAAHWIRPDGLSLFNNSCMARSAEWKYVRVFFVRKP
jgi:hypothetical protein